MEKLTDLKCKNAKPKSKPYRLYDGRGLFLQVMPNGGKYWRFKYRFLHKEKLRAFGVYPEISLKTARQECLNARKMISENIDPAVAKRHAKLEAKKSVENSFESVARKWHDTVKDKWGAKHAETVLHRLEVDIFSEFGKLPIASIKPMQIIGALKKVESRGANEPAHRLKQYCSQIFRYAIINDMTHYNVAAEVGIALKPLIKRHYPCIQSAELPKLLKALDRNNARLHADTRIAIRLLMLTFVRTKELIEATWDEFDLERAIWVIPAHRMKMRRTHIVPLSKQALELLIELKSRNEKWNWVFPGHHSRLKHMSNNTVLKGLERLGYKGQMTGHGFRALAMSTIKESLGYRHEIVDRQLAHLALSHVDRAYCRAPFLEERTKMMQEYADYIDQAAKTSETIVNFVRAA